MKNRLSFIAGLILLAPFTFAEPSPAAAPAKDEIPALIKQLGDDSPKIRDQASQQLRKLAGDALPALTQAQKSDDPEVVSRARTITKQIDEDLHPKAKVDPNSPFLNRLPRQVLVGPGGNIRVRMVS